MLWVYRTMRFFNLSNRKLCLFKYFDQNTIKLEPNEIQLDVGEMVDGKLVTIGSFSFRKCF